MAAARKAPDFGRKGVHPYVGTRLAWRLPDLSVFPNTIMLTQKAKYALRALAVLAEARGEGPLPIHTVADRAHAPHKFLEAILLQLRRLGVVDSTRGKAGGYVLAKPSEQVSLGYVIRSIDGPLAPIPCASLTAYRPCTDCPDPEECSIRHLMRQVRDAMAKILDTATVADLCAGKTRVPGLDDAA